jgi:imidazolonepropionase-like amidohydrolase
LDDLWEKLGQYSSIESTDKPNLKYYPEMEALLPVYRGEMTLLIEVNYSEDILEAIQWVGKNKIQKVIFTGVLEGWRVATQIKESGFPVIVGPILSLPAREYDRYDIVYQNAALLKEAGVKFSIRSKEVENARNLPFHAGFAASYGLGKEEALKAVTIYPAEIFGVSDQLGSLEVGKQATLFISDGDPFEPRTQIKQVFIGGYKIPMESRQTELYKEYLNRIPSGEE